MFQNAQKRKRRSIRLKEYDYSKEGAYFVTICTRNRECILGEITKERVILKEFGKIVESAWLDLPRHYPNIELDAHVIMPNHVHGIICIVGAGFKPAPTQKRYPLSEVVRGFKTFSSRRMNEIRLKSGTNFWQRNYYEHIIRDENSLNRIREYIRNNPLRWGLDKENPYRKGEDEFELWFEREFKTRSKSRSN